LKIERKYENALREQERLIDQRKKNVKGLNMPKPEINREKSQNINEQLKKLRERVGN